MDLESAGPDAEWGSEPERDLMLTRIKLHLHCPCRNWQQARFHLMGILREFVPLRWQEHIR